MRTEATRTQRAWRWMRQWQEDLLSGNPDRQFEMIAMAVVSTTSMFTLLAPHPWLIGMNALCASVSATLLLAHQWRPEWRVWLTWLLWGMIQITAINGVIWQGGVWSLAMGYFFASSVGMLMMINVRAVVISTTIMVIIVAVLALIEAKGWIQPSVVAPDNLLWPLTLFTSLLFAFISLPLVAHQTQKRLAKQLKVDNQALSDTHEELRQQHRMQEQFVASVSHELRTPMNAIMGFLQTIDRADHLNADELEMLDLMEHSAQTLLLRINELLDFSQLQAGKLRIRPQAMQLRQEIDQVVRPFIDELGGKPVRLSVLVAPDVPQWLHADPERVKQIVHNLLSNAVKFTQRGDIRIAVTRLEGTHVQLTVSDTGPGIAEAELERIFNRLSTITSRTRREMGGTGLGLSIAKALVELMGGHLHVQSQLGKGSDFTITLPLLAAQAPEDTGINDQAVEASEVTGRVLIVDDSPVNRLVAQNLLRAELPKLTIVEADSGAQALQLMEAQTVDLVLMDIVMPGMSGIEAATRIKQRWGDQAPEIMGLTADTSEEVSAQSLRAGMSGIIHKPFSRASLGQPVLNALRQSAHS